MIRTSAKLTIFEGPDGAGKSTAALLYAAKTNAKYVHFDSLPRVSKNLGRMYVEAMLPALLGYQDVVFDRSWLSEMPYGVAFRAGRDRLTNASRRMLERVALRCGAVLVKCEPAWEIVKANYLSRRKIELLQNEDQLQLVYNLYHDQVSDLSTVMFNYTHEALDTTAIEKLRPRLHPLELASAGNWEARHVLVGTAFAERKDHDPWYQFPFGSFSAEGCSQWFTEQLQLANVSERDLLWINADQDLSCLHELKAARVFALGTDAAAKLHEQNITAVLVPHPQAQKRFRSDHRYELLDYL